MAMSYPSQATVHCSLFFSHGSPSMIWKRSKRVLRLLPATALLSACSAAGPTAGPPSLPPATVDSATRSAPVVPGRPARVFVFAGWDGACATLAAPQVTVTSPPAQGEVSFRPGQETTIAGSATGPCAGKRATGTGVYYTARAGAAGSDRFAVEARLASGETSARVFEVGIAD